VREAAIRLPDCIVDAELVANDGEGRHSYDKLMSGYFLPNVWCFDLLATDGVELRGLQLERRGKSSATSSSKQIVRCSGSPTSLS
jgi:ATP-dependent DNA ligase